MHSIWIRIIALLALASALAGNLPAQSSGSGAISGVLTDAQGAVVPDAKIVVRSLETGETRVVHSAPQGTYRVSSLPPGDYSVEVSKEGFKTTSVTRFTVHTTNTEALNVRLEVGAASQSVTVEANAERLQLESSSLGHVTTGEAVESLPLVTRNYTEIIGLNPGVTTEVNNAGDLGRGNGGNPTADGEFSVAGVSGMDNSFQINGVVVNDFQQSGAFSGGIPIPNPDTIREFKVQTAPFDASYGRDAGGNVNLVTRTGQNSLHGSAFEYLRNEDMNANDYFRNEAKQGRALLRQNQFGFALGGPVKHDKLFFFTSYQGTRQKNGLDTRCSASFFQPPLTNDRSAATLGALFAGQPTFWQLSGLAAATGLPGATVAPNGSNISPVALALLNLKLANGQYVIPTPQTINGSKPFAQQGFSTISSACPFNEDQGMANLQWNQSEKSTWELRGFRVNSNETLTLNYIQLGGSPVPGFPTNVPNKFRDGSITNSYVLSPTLLNHLLIGWHEDLTSTSQATPFSWSSLGATVNPFDILPQVSIVGSIGIGGNGQTINFGQNTYQLQDDISWNRGRHNLRFGAGGERYDDNIKSFNYLSGTLFETWPDFLLGESAAQNGTLISNIIASVDLPGLLARHYRAWDWNVYGQDDLHATTRLTFNLGFRLEHLGDVGENTGRNANFDFAHANPNPPAGGTLQGFVVANNFPGTLPAGVVSSGNNLAIKGIGQNTLNPRAGFAWLLPGSDKVVLRGGYGVYHERYSGQPLVQTLTNEPWAVVRQPQVFANASASLLQPFAPLSITFPNFVPYSPTTSIGGEVFDQNFRPAMVQHYSLNVQDQITPDTVLEVGYLGSRGTRLMSQVLVNEPLTASASNPVHGVTTNSFKNATARAPIPGISVQGFVALESNGQSWYNALEASLLHRTHWGLQGQASYTWGHSLSDTAGTLNGSNGGTLVGDQYNRHHAYGTDAFVRPQRLVLSFNYALPLFGRNPRSFTGETLGGWGLSGVYTLQTGQRLLVSNSNAANVNGITTDFAQIVPGCNTTTPGSIESRLGNYINAACFVPYPAIAADGTTGFGNSRPGVVIGPGQNNVNLALIKRFSVKTWTEGSNFEFRAEAFNALNHPQFTNPNTAQNSSAFGTITSQSVNPRVMQLALKFNF
ncbi:MAG: carboxypeptidase regulatory-like domain-containing protein [Acidobacteria bacterium]|nr:carboxypeptidase regulatory-like domain-containing protein [Acidobacteriota bacterium]